MSLTKVSYSMITGAPVNVLDFGATGDGSTDDTPAFNSAITAMYAAGRSQLYIPAGTYYLANPVVVNFDNEQMFSMVGESMAGFFTLSYLGTKIIGAAGMESMFIFTKTNLLVPTGYSFSCENISFVSSALGVGGPLTAIKNKIGGAPARPFNVTNCFFVGFDKGIVSDLSSTGGLTTGICQVNIHNSTFVSNNFALYGTGGLGSIMDLNFTGNVSENGGAIYIDELAGTFNISDNLLEGQANAVHIEMALGNGTIARNYFEANSGYLMYFGASNPDSSVTESDNYITNCAGTNAYFRNMRVESKTNFANVGVLCEAVSCTSKSSLNNNGIVNPNEWSIGNYRFNLNSISKQTTVPPGTLTNGGYEVLPSGPVATPVGSITFQSIASTFTNYMSPAAISLAAGDAVVAMAIARRTANNPFIYLAVYNNAFGFLANSDTSQNLVEAAVGEWVFIAAIVKVSATSGGAPQIRWVSVGGTADVSATYFYKVAAPTNNSTPAYLCMLTP